MTAAGGTAMCPKDTPGELCAVQRSASGDLVKQTLTTVVGLEFRNYHHSLWNLYLGFCPYTSEPSSELCFMNGRLFHNKKD